MDKILISHYLSSIAESFHNNENETNFQECKTRNSLANFSTSSLSRTPDRKNSRVPSNPFTIEPSSFSVPSFSPSVFNSTDEKNEEKLENQSFSWDIEQLSCLNPVEIDESSIQRPLDELDEHEEEQAQQAIQSYFSQNNILPSPWGGSAKHVTFSPHLPSTKFFNETNSSTSSNEEPAKRDVFTQTTLSIPMSVNLEAILGQFFTFNEDQNHQCENVIVECATLAEQDLLSQSTLRRKLFMCSPNRQSSSSERSNKIKTPSKSPSSVKYKTPDNNRSSIINSGQLFSSSPISLRAFSVSPCHSISALDENFISPIKRGSSVFCSGERKTGIPGRPIAYLKSILKSSPGILSDFAMREMRDLKDELECNNSSQMTVSMKTESGNSLDDSESSDEGLNLTTEMKFEPLIRQSENDIPLIPPKDSKVPINELPPDSAYSQDTGYQTESHPGTVSEMDISVFYNNYNNNNSKKTTLGITKASNFSNSNATEFCQLDLTSQNPKPCTRRSIFSDSVITDSNLAMDVATQHPLRSVSEENRTESLNQDSIMHISQSNWKPGECSTPQSEKLRLVEF